MSCSCKNIIPQSQECYDRMILLDIPEHMIKYRENRVKDGFGDKIIIDPCIVDEIKMLWKNGIITYGCCCGHNIMNPYVNVDDSNIQQMLDMGYVQEHWDKSRKDTFRLKSV